MTPLTLAPRVAEIASVPFELLDYVQWLQGSRRDPNAPRDYLFSASRPRFEPRKSDVLVALPGLRVQSQGRSVRLRCDAPKVDIDLAGIGQREADRILSLVDGRRCSLEIRWEANVDQATMARFLRATFGHVLYAPAAVESLECRLPSAQIVRFPCPPYAIERAYWENMVAVRQRLLQWNTDPGGRSLVELLQELHVLTLLGASLNNFYKPSSPASDQAVAPGRFLLSEPRLLRTPKHVIFLDGPRVNVALAGCDFYLRVLSEGLGDPEAASDDREFSADGLPWGGVVRARSEKDDSAGLWFCPPRPLQQEHFDFLQQCLGRMDDAAGHSDAATLIEAAAAFHQAFVRLHPFHCANQSLAMNVVNAFLTQGLGAGIPHLVLDMLALRLSKEAYAQAFRRAVSSFLITESDPARRFSILMERRQRSEAMIRGIANQADMDRDPDAARWALLRD